MTAQPDQQSAECCAGACRHVANKSMSAEGFYAERYKCKMPQGTYIGCIPAGVPTFATAMAGLLDAHKVYLPLRLIITGWSNNANPATEPGTKAKGVTARYRLAFQPGANVQPGQRFSIYRCDRAADGRGVPPANPTSASQLAAAGCRSWSFSMGAASLQQLSHRTLGVLRPNSVVYFLAVLQR
jgi:hypothetical protein